MRTVLFINAHSRQAEAHIDAVKSYLSSTNCPFTLIKTIVVRELDELQTSIEQLREITDVECVIVGSGDGTIVAILNALRDRPKLVYGFLPLGTSNTFVRSLGLPNDFEATLNIFKGQHVRTVSLGSVNETLFANIIGMGVPTKVADNISDRAKRFFGPLAYLVSGTKELIRHKAFYCTVEADGVTERFYTHHMLVANGAYHGHMEIGMNSSPDTNKLVIVAFGTSKSRWQYLKSITRFGINKHESDKNTLMLSVDHAKITTKPRRKIEADGELVGRTPAEVKVVANAISVLVQKS